MKVKLLYVEDEPSLGRIVKESLESRDFEVWMIDDGKDAVSAFHNFKPNICVLDIMLPSKDGYTIAKEIKAIEPGLPILFLTAKLQVDDILKGFASGGNDYIRKPFSMEELIVRIHNLLSLSNGDKKILKAGNITIGKYVYNPDRYELRLGDVAKKLSHREASLLLFLLEHQNATALRKDILLKLWGDDSFFNSRNLDVYITKLRDYLKHDPAIEIITIKGIGYRFSTSRS